MNVCLKTLTCGVNGTGLSSLLNVERVSNITQERHICYSALINVGDGCQRFCIENRIKLNKLSVVIITSLAPHNISGLCGIIHCISTLGNEKLTIIGPNGIKTFYSIISERIVNRKYPIVDIIEISSHFSQLSPYEYSNEYFTHHIFGVQPRLSENVIALSGSIQILKPLAQNLNITNSTAVIFTSYSDHFQVKTGFNEYHKLINETILSPHSKILSLWFPISISDCISKINNTIDDFIATNCCESIIPCGIVFNLSLSMKTLEFVAPQRDLCVLNKLSSSFFHSNKLQHIDTNLMETDIWNDLNTLVWAQPLQLVERLSMDDANRVNVNDTVQLFSRNNDLMISEIASYVDERLAKYKLHQASLSSTLTIPSQACTDISEDCDSLKRTTNQSVSSNLESAALIRKSILEKFKRKRIEIIDDVSDELKTSELPCDVTPISKISSTLLDEVASKVVTRPSNTACEREPQINITFLGTGSAVPSKHRNQSGILLSFPKSPQIKSTWEDKEQDMNNIDDMLMLLDAGEGITGQIYMGLGFLSNMEFYRVINRIRIIWISHHHADHMSGIPLLLEYIHRSHQILRKLNDSSHTSSQKVLIVCPVVVKQYIEYMSIVAGMDDIIKLIISTDLMYAGNAVDINLISRGIITKINNIPVYHCYQSYGVILEIYNKYKLVYSGDCRPNQTLVNIGRNCDLLIHEATFDDSMCNDAVSKKHCTRSEAIDISRHMNAKHLILTHFSQRYPIVPTAINNMKMIKQTDSNTNRSFEQYPKEHQSIAIAFDFLKFQFPSQIKELETQTQNLVTLFSVGSE